MATNNVYGENLSFFGIKRDSSFHGCRDDLSSASPGHPYDILWVKAVTGIQGYTKYWVLQRFPREITEIRFSFKAEISPISVRTLLGKVIGNPVEILKLGSDGRYWLIWLAHKEAQYSKVTYS